MEHIIEELIAIIAQEIDAFNELLKTLHQKQRAIVEGEIDRLNKSVQVENKIAGQTKSLEAERQERARELAEKLSLETVNPKLTEIIEKVEAKYALRLQEQRELLKSLVGKVQNLNENNQFLLDYSLKFIEKSMELLLNGEEKKKFYQANGKLDKKLQKSKLINHCI